MHLGLVVEVEEWAPGICVVEFSLRLHISNITGSFKLERPETGATEVCVTSMDIAISSLF